ncbi:MAG: UDP-N-acetylglucosamine 2-epimerase (hydrolyzing) [Phycisphaeraceae bacterium]|nr:UDP-N-acetylglucosamine 2-epimerase (hydrolyzing) [Phycisphaeraceae bacterium]
MPKKRTIAVISGSRADFGLLEPVLRAIAARKDLRLRTIVTGLHETTGTWRDVRAAGFAIAARVKMQQPSRCGRAQDVQALARGVAGLGRALQKLRADVAVVLGDRIEALAGALAAGIGGIHLAHIHGGDRAEGVADESIRHAISKLAHLHFPATAGSQKRLIRMGENPRAVLRTGSPAIDGLKNVTPARNSPRLIVLQHPVGGSDAQEQKWMRETLAATAAWPRLVLMPNADPGSDGIRRAIAQGKISAVTHLPRAKFLSLLAGCGAIVGNSSAGLIEAAALRIPCVNVGPRQAGREKPANVIACANSRRAIRAAITRALKLNRRRLNHPYGLGHAGPRIAAHLAKVNLAALPLRKRNSY